MQIATKIISYIDGEDKYLATVFHEDLLDYLREKNLPTEDMRWNRPEVIHYEVLTEESLPDTETERTMDATAMTLRRLSNTPGLRLCNHQYRKQTDPIL